MDNQDISMSVQKVEMAFQGMAHILSKGFDFKGIEAVLLKGLKSDVCSRDVVGTIFVIRYF